MLAQRPHQRLFTNALGRHFLCHFTSDISLAISSAFYRLTSKMNAANKLCVRVCVSTKSNRDR